MKSVFQTGVITVHTKNSLLHVNFTMQEAFSLGLIHTHVCLTQRESVRFFVWLI